MSSLNQAKTKDISTEKSLIVFISVASPPHPDSTHQVPLHEGKKGGVASPLWYRKRSCPIVGHSHGLQTAGLDGVNPGALRVEPEGSGL